MFKDQVKQILTDRINSNLTTVSYDGKNTILGADDYVVKNVTKSGNTATIDVEVIAGDFKGDKFTLTTELIAPSQTNIVLPVVATREQIWLALLTDYQILLTQEQYDALPEKLSGERVIIDMSSSYRYTTNVEIDTTLSVKPDGENIGDKYTLDSYMWMQEPWVYVDMGTVAKLWVRVFNTSRKAFDRAWDAACLVAIYRQNSSDTISHAPAARTALNAFMEAKETLDGGKQSLSFVAGEKVVVELSTTNLNAMYSWNLEMGHHVNILELARTPWRIKDMWGDIDISGEELKFIGDTEALKTKYSINEDETVTAEQIALLPKGKLVEREFRSEDLPNAGNIVMYGMGKNDSFTLNAVDGFSRYMMLITQTPEGEMVEDMDALNLVLMLYGRDNYDMKFYVHYELTEDRVIVTSSVTFPEYINHVGGLVVRIKLSYPITNRVWETTTDEITVDEMMGIDEALTGQYFQDTGLQILKELSVSRYASMRFTVPVLNKQIHGKYRDEEVTGKSVFTKTVLAEEKKTVYLCERTGFKVVIAEV